MGYFCKFAAKSSKNLNSKRFLLFSAFIVAVMACNGQNSENMKRSEKTDAVLECIMMHTNIRQYTDEPVSKADIETMIRAGMAAPTAGQSTSAARLNRVFKH